MTAQFSLEFFPPRTDEGIDKLRAARRQLAQLHPSFCSVTFGAGGSTREGTLATVLEIRGEGIDAAPHISCIGSTVQSLRAVLSQYRESGIRHVVALRGDMPSGTVDAGEFRYANELVEFIRLETGDWFHVDVAAYPEVHPQARSAVEDLAAFKRKVDAGADSAITQYFYHPHAYVDFVNRSRRAGIEIPIYPGIMPITNYEGIVRFSENCGADIPRWMKKHLESLRDDAAGLRAFAIEAVTRLCEELLAAGAPGLHFYTLNRWGATLAICRNLGLVRAAP